MVVSPAFFAVMSIGIEAALTLIDEGTVATEGSEEETERNCGADGAAPNLARIDCVLPLAILSRPGAMAASSLRMVACPFLMAKDSVLQQSRLTVPLMVNCLSISTVL